VDSHYTLVSSADPNAPGPNAYVVLQSTGFPIPPWIADGPSSTWIAPQADQSSGNAVGNYDYRTTVNLTGFGPRSAFLSGRFASDNELSDILVNGVTTGINDREHQYRSFTPYTISGRFFHEGLNTIDFIVHNDGGPTGFRNEMGVVAEPTTPTPPLPAGFLDGDVGAVGAAGSADFSNGTYTISASGSDIWGTADAFHYVYQTLSGDGTIVARVDSLGNTDPWAKAGVMIRESMDPGSMFADMVVTPGNGAAFQRRDANGAFAIHTPGPSVQAPYWVELVRTGSVVTGYVSPDGQNWTVVGSDFIPLSANVYLGLAVTAHNNSAVTPATFDEVAVTTQAIYGSQAINSGGGAAGSFAPDTDYTMNFGGTYSVAASVDTSGVTNPAPQAVYQTERWGNFTYTIPHLAPNRLYHVRLHFAEIFWNAPGQRQFNVDINGEQVLTSFDVFSAAGGSDKAVVEDFLAQSDARGEIVIQYNVDAVNFPKSSGIEVLAADGAGTVLATGQAFGATEGQQVTRVVASFTDTDAVGPTNFTPLILWGDGTYSRGDIRKNDQGGFDVVGTHTYAEEGSYVVASRIQDERDNLRIVVRGMADVRDAPIRTQTIRSPNVSPGVPFTVPVAAFTDIDPFGVVADYLAMVDWGDGHTSRGKVVADQSAFEVLGTHRYAAVGDYTVTITTSDRGGQQDTSRLLIHVS
jgi:hypothetical protein